MTGIWIAVYAAHEPQTLVVNELHGPDGFVNRALLGLVGSQLVFPNEHARLAFWLPLGE
jgi:hypothetical protein